MIAYRLLALFTAILLVCADRPAAAQGQLLQACARGNVQVCFALLNRPRLDPGRRAGIELHLAELEALLVACRSGDAAACTNLSQKHPDLPPDMRPQDAKPPAKSD